MENINSISIFLPSLLTAWEAQGNAVDVHQHLQIKQLMDKLPNDIELKEFKTILSPILANDVELQSDFYQLFDDLLPTFTQRFDKHQAAVEKIVNTKGDTRIIENPFYNRKKANLLDAEGLKTPKA